MIARYMTGQHKAQTRHAATAKGGFCRTELQVPNRLQHAPTPRPPSPHQHLKQVCSVACIGCSQAESEVPLPSLNSVQLSAVQTCMTTVNAGNPGFIDWEFVRSKTKGEREVRPRRSLPVRSLAGS